jgi:hypothetical protein
MPADQSGTVKPSNQSVAGKVAAFFVMGEP